MIKDILSNIVNKKEDENNLITATVYSMDPLQVKIYPGDDPINVKSLVGVVGITNGSNVLMLKYLSKFIIIGVIGSPMTKFIDYVIKQSDESRNSDTTMTDDSELTLTLPPNGKYQIDLMLYVRADSSTPDIKVDYDHSNTSNLSYRNAWGAHEGTSSTAPVDIRSSYYGIDTDIPYGATGDSNETCINETLFVETSDDEGTITVRWAQNTSSTDYTTVKSGSVFKYTRIDSFPILGAGEGGAATPAESPTGSVTQFAGSSAPTGWLLCDGSAVSRTTYSTLFSLIGETYGVGDGSTTFNLPDLKGKIPVGYNSSDGDFDALGETGGAKTHTLTSDEMPSHTHTQNSHNHTQDSHTHTQNSHTHTQNAHTHTQNSHDHDVRYRGFSITPSAGGYLVLRRQDAGDSYDGTDGDAAIATTATNQNTTATNQSTTATNQSTTATNQSTTATNQNTGGGSSHNNLQPYITLNYIIKT